MSLVPNTGTCSERPHILLIVTDRQCDDALRASGLHFTRFNSALSGLHPRTAVPRCVF